MKTDREVLEGALELVSRDEGWCKGTYCAPKGQTEGIVVTALADISGCR